MYVYTTMLRTSDQACGNTTPDLPDSVRESAGQAMFQDLLVHGQVKK